MPAPKITDELVERFAYNEKQYCVKESSHGQDNQESDSEEYIRFKRLLTALVAVPKSEIYELAPKLKPKSKKKKRAARKKATD
jgi:hypothetical protein